MPTDEYHHAINFLSQELEASTSYLKHLEESLQETQERYARLSDQIEETKDRIEGFKVAKKSLKEKYDG